MRLVCAQIFMVPLAMRMAASIQCRKLFIYFVVFTLYFQEDTVAVQYVEEKPADGDVGGAGEERLCLFG